MKTPKCLMEPPQGWIDPHGLGRAAKAAAIQASHFREARRPDATAAVAEFGRALNLAAAKEGVSSR